MDSAENAGRNWSNWIEIPVEEFERAQSFYETIFDIEIQVMDLGALKMGIFPGRTVGCAICKGVHYAPGASGPVVYLDANPDQGSNGEEANFSRTWFYGSISRH